MVDLTAQDTRLKETVASFEEKLKALEEKAGRNERRAILAEREVSFLQAMLVSFYSTPLAHVTETPHHRPAITPKTPAKVPHRLSRRNSNG